MPTTVKRESREPSPARSISLRDCVMNLVFYVGVLGALALFFPHFRSPFWVNLLCLWAMLAPLPFHTLRDWWHIRRTGKPVALTFEQNERRTGAALHWGAVSYTVYALVVIAQSALFWWSTLFAPGAAPTPARMATGLLTVAFTLLLYGIPALMLWNMAAASRRYLSRARGVTRQ